MLFAVLSLTCHAQRKEDTFVVYMTQQKAEDQKCEFFETVTLQGIMALYANEPRETMSAAQTPFGTIIVHKHAEPNSMKWIPMVYEEEYILPLTEKQLINGINTFDYYGGYNVFMQNIYRKSTNDKMEKQKGFLKHPEQYNEKGYFGKFFYNGKVMLWQDADIEMQTCRESDSDEAFYNDFNNMEMRWHIESIRILYSNSKNKTMYQTIYSKYKNPDKAKGLVKICRNKDEAIDFIQKNTKDGYYIERVWGGAIDYDALEKEKDRKFDELMDKLSATGSALNAMGTSMSSSSSPTSSSTSTKGSGSTKGKCKVCNGTGTCSAKSGSGRKNSCHGSGLCGYCNGTGWTNASGSKVVCQACDGNKACKTCHGTGKCPACGGTGGK